jgi:hypothetical protein
VRAFTGETGCPPTTNFGPLADAVFDRLPIQVRKLTARARTASATPTSSGGASATAKTQCGVKFERRLTKSQHPGLQAPPLPERTVQPGRFRDPPAARRRARPDEGSRPADIAGRRPGPDRLSDAAASPPERHAPEPAVITAIGQNLNIRVFTGVVPSIELLVQLLPRANEFVTVRCIILDFCTSATAARGPFRGQSETSALDLGLAASTLKPDIPAPLEKRGLTLQLGLQKGSSPKAETRHPVRDLRGSVSERVERDRRSRTLASMPRGRQGNKKLIRHRDPREPICRERRGLQ